jgi:3-hexulose-6-phosphate synthase
VLLQLAIDCFTLQEALQIVEETADVIDIVETGTPLILREGIGAVQSLRSRFPSLRIAADMKIIDGADYESRLAFDAGADIVTVLGAAENRTIHLAKRAAEEYGKEVMVDMIGIGGMAERARELDTLGVDFFCVHLVTDLGVPGSNILHELKAVRGAVPHAQIAIAGGINLHILQSISGAKPDIAIVGSSITKSENRREVALTIKNSMK